MRTILLVGAALVASFLVPAFAGATDGGWCAGPVCVQTCFADDACIDPEACLATDPWNPVLGECADLTRECLDVQRHCGPPH